jgi:hypothetical protein
MREKPVGHLVVILFISVLGANIIGESLRLVLHFVAGGGSIVERALLDYVTTYPIGPHSLNLIILSLSFELSLHFNVITLLGIFVGWYYFKYSY